METELRKFKKLPSLNFTRENRIAFSLLDDAGKYTSLKDILPHSPTFTTATNYEGNGFESNISIRNQLVKQAASAYLQSAILTHRHQHWVVQLWRRMHGEGWWNIYVKNPLRACTGHILGILAQILRQLGGVWSGRGSIETCILL
ncbi:hypothetical protein ACHQM5_004424 [Ranunculus cassubicifolius]